MRNFLLNYIPKLGFVALLIIPIMYAVAADYEIAFSEQDSYLGDTVEITWQAPAGSTNRYRQFNVYSVGSGEEKRVLSRYLSRNETEGTYSFKPRTGGTYEVRLITDRTEVVAVSDELVVTDRSLEGYEVSVEGGTFGPGAVIVVNFVRPLNDRNNSFIGIYPAGLNSTRAETRLRLPQGVTEGRLFFFVDDPGEYEVRLYARSRILVATADETVSIARGGAYPQLEDYTIEVSETVLAPRGEVTVSYDTPVNDFRRGDRIGLFRVDDPRNRALARKSVSRTSARGEVTFTIREAGTYEFKYLKRNGRTTVARSEQIVVGNTEDNEEEVFQCQVPNLNQITNYPQGTGPIIAFGDSLTTGVGASNNQDYVSQLERKLDVTIINAGVSGDTTAEAAERLSRDVLQRDPSVVIVWLGGNDIIGRFYEDARDGLEEVSSIDWLRLAALRLSGKIPDSGGITEDETFENLTRIIERIQETGAVTIVVGFSGGIFDENLEDRYEQLARDTGSLYVPDALNNVIGRPSRMSDLVHPNNEGYGIVASRVALYLSCVIPE
jgi:lysophospholipase L1-like esterase